MRHPKITIDQAIEICGQFVTQHPKLKKVIVRIGELREERDMFRTLASKYQSEASWEKSSLKKWADKQRTCPDND